MGRNQEIAYWKRQYAKQTRRDAQVHWHSICPSHPEDGETHECMESEMRCSYCGYRIHPYPCHGCGKFMSTKEMGPSGEGNRCEECQ